MKRRLAALALAGALGLTAGCQDFLDVNTNPNAPERVAANLYLPPLLHWMVTTQAWDGRCTSQYTQMLTQSGFSTYDIHGTNLNTDTCGEQWRTTYWIFGQNLIDMMDRAEAEKRWDILGAGYVMKAWGWLQTTNLHGEIIVKQAFNQGTSFTFDYDTQEVAYEETKRMLDSAIVYLGMTGDAVDATFMARGDKMYNGDRLKWLKFAHGLYAIALSHYSNKSSYDPQAIIAHVDQSFTSNADDALWSFPNLQNDDRNFMGPSRNNYMSYRQTRFIVGLLNGTVFGTEDPRMRRMLATSPDSIYRGLSVGESFTALPAAQRANNPAGYEVVPPTGSPGLYLFGDVVKFPAMTYSQLQFVKAEAAFRAGNKTLALQAHRNGVSSHVDFVNDRNRETGRANFPPISAAEKAALLANTEIVPADPSALTLQQIMSQKFIAQWGWAYNEAWMDMRRYHYTDLDPAVGEPVFPGWEMPTTIASANNGKLAYRLRPRYNSEYVWNAPALEKIGGLALDYNTVIPWILQP
ncbi:MAG TPA: SusD/RagB family nutrient-binding outer membrane lipoprotein [Gemmatimonadaceae bacterium]|nr:SusD/RagB family nutrient-binding outer membrane lipoprotein [Gemmatimonadaceae bacterium]